MCWTGKCLELYQCVQRPASRTSAERRGLRVDALRNGLDESRWPAKWVGTFGTAVPAIPAVSRSLERKGRQAAGREAPRLGACACSSASSRCPWRRVPPSLCSRERPDLQHARQGGSPFCFLCRRKSRHQGLEVVAVSPRDLKSYNVSALSWRCD